MDGKSKKAHARHTRIGSTGPYPPKAHIKVERHLQVVPHGHDGHASQMTRKAHRTRRGIEHPLTDAGTR